MSVLRDHLWSSPGKKRQLKMGWQDATQYILITVFFYCIIISRLNLAGMADSRFYLIRSRDTFQLFISF